MQRYEKNPYLQIFLGTLLQKSEENGQNQQAESHKVIPVEGLSLEQEVGDDGKYRQRNDFLNDLELQEVERAAVNACEHALDIQMSDKPNLPYLNRARVEWLSVYVGRKEFGGLTEIGQKFDPGEEPDYPFRCRLLRARERMDDPLVSRLIRAYEEDLEEGEKMLDGKKLE